MSEELSDNLAIHTESLGRIYSRRWVVDDLGLSVKQGAVYGFLGLNGAGKSTTIRMLMGLIRAHAGTAQVLGLDSLKQGIEVKRRVGYVAETPNFYEWMSIAEICGFVAHYRKGEWDQGRATNLMSRFDLDPTAKIRTLSKGQKAKTSLLLALAFNPDLLILDEPTSGLDPIARREFVENILAEFQESGRTIFVSSHLINEIAGLVDHVGLLHEGKLVVESSVEDFLSSVRRVRLAFDSDAPREIACKNMLKLNANGREATVVVSPFDEQETIDELKRFEPSKIETESMNLEDAFIEVIGAKKAKV